MTETWHGRTTGDPDGNWAVSDSRGDGTRPPGYIERARRHGGSEPDHLDLPPHLDSREQRRRRAARFGETVVNEMEAKVDAMSLTPGALGRENVLSLMEGMCSRSGDALVRELIRLVRRLAAEPGNRAVILQRVAGIERELDAAGRL